MTDSEEAILGQALRTQLSIAPHFGASDILAIVRAEAGQEPNNYQVQMVQKTTDQGVRYHCQLIWGNFTVKEPHHDHPTISIKADWATEEVAALDALCKVRGLPRPKV